MPSDVQPGEEMREGIVYGNDAKITPADRLKAAELLQQVEDGGPTARALVPAADGRRASQ